jgi:Right handed beta helix region
MKTKLTTLLALPFCTFTALAQGPLSPPGPPGPTMKSLDQVEPRTVITSLPYTMSMPGSYIVGANLRAPTGSTTGITISSSNVTLDLNGFTLSGQLTATTAIVAGISVTQVTVKNGNIEGWTGDGLNLGTAINVSVDRVSVRAVSGRGIVTNFYASVTGCRVENTGGTGYQIADDSIINDCIAATTTGAGFTLSADCVASGLMVYQTQGTSPGITAGESAFVRSSVVRSAAGSGIVLGAMATASDCTVRGSGVYGIRAGTRSTVTSCRALANNQAGIFADNSVRLEKCHSSLNGTNGISIGAYCTVSECTVADHRAPGFSFTNQTVGRAGIVILGTGNIISRCQLTRNDFAFEADGSADGMCLSNHVRNVSAPSAITVAMPTSRQPPVNRGTGAFGEFARIGSTSDQPDGVNYFSHTN